MKVQGMKWERAEPILTTSGTASSPVSANCADIMFINTSTTATYLIDGQPLLPLSSMIDGCNQGEYNEHTYSVIGPAPAVVSGVLTGLFVRRKKYTRTIDL